MRKIPPCLAVTFPSKVLLCSGYISVFIERWFGRASFGKYDPSSRAFSELNCSGKLLSVHGAFCDLEGYCRITGITVAKDRWMRKVLEAVEIRDGSGRVLAAWEPSVHFEGHAQKRIHDAFWVTLRLHKSALKQVCLEATDCLERVNVLTLNSSRSPTIKGSRCIWICLAIA